MKRHITVILTIAALAVSQIPMLAMAAVAETVNITDPNFKFTVCDGPDLSKMKTGSVTLNHAVTDPSTGKVTNEKVVVNANGPFPDWYHACNFNTLISTAQHLINIAIVIGVFVALGSFCYIGYLYLTGKEKNISLAHSILPKVFFGFIMMLSAWFIVYELLSWLGTSPGFRSLLGSP